jgi:gluconate 5-dehydrogenase
MAFELFNLVSRRALVTGSSQGIGLAIARGLAEHGASVVVGTENPIRVDDVTESPKLAE